MRPATFNKLKLFMLCLLAMAWVTSCKTPKKMGAKIKKIEFKNNPEALEVHGDSVQININGKFPAKTFNKNAIAKFQPILKYGDGQEMILPPMYLKGEKVKAVPGEPAKTKTINYSKGGSFNYTHKMEYTPEMKKANLGLDYAIKFDSKYDELDQCFVDSIDQEGGVARGTITTSLTVKPTDDLYMFNNDVPSGGSRVVTFYYVINEGKLRDSVTRKPSPALIQLRDFVSNKDFQIKRIQFRSFASPDGEMQFNAKLTEQRAASANTLVSNEMKRLKIANVYDSTFIRMPDPNKEDWSGLRRIVQSTSVNIPEKDGLLNILNSNASPEEKERQMRAHASWEVLKRDILPRLRRTEVVMHGEFPNRSLEEVRKISGENRLADLTEKELILLANNSKDTAEMIRVYDHHATRYPNSWAGRNNYGVILVKQGRYEQARTIFDSLHRKFPNNDTLHNNLGVALRHLRKYDSAKVNYNFADRALDERNNLGILYIKYGDYESAINSFEADRCDYNVALAYTLKGDYEPAAEKVQCALNKTTQGSEADKAKRADLFYLRAIIGARKGDRDLMTTALTRAIQENPEYRQIAKEDLEFRNFWETDNFKNAIRE